MRRKGNVNMYTLRMYIRKISDLNIKQMFICLDNSCGISC